MTDPRMTPTNDAPVTVERLRAQLQAKIRAGFCAEDTEDGDVNFCGECHWCLHILSERRLAALASAPAGDGELREALQRIADKGPAKGSGESYKAWARTIARRAIAAALARPRAAVDPEVNLKAVAETLADYRAYLDGMTPLQHAEVAWEAGHKWPDEDDFDYASRVLQVLDALPDLVSPRAAVGEREA